MVGILEGEVAASFGNLGQERSLFWASRCVSVQEGCAWGVGEATGCRALRVGDAWVGGGGERPELPDWRCRAEELKTDELVLPVWPVDHG